MARLRRLARHPISTVRRRIQRVRKARAAVRRRVDFYRQFVGAGDLVFDVGANIGNRVEAFTKLGARVVAIEPQAACASQLRKRWPDIVVEQVGLGAEPGHAELRLGEASAISSMSPEFVAATTASGRFGTLGWQSEIEVVPITSMDVLIARHGLPTFVKIDVEGYERQVLAGLSQPVAAVSFEVTAELGEEAVACIDRLVELAPYRFALSFGESMRLGPWMTIDEARAAVRSMSDLEWGDLYARRSS